MKIFNRSKTPLFYLNKRRKFVLSTFILTLILISTTFLSGSWQYISIAILGAASLLFTVWSLSRDWVAASRITTSIISVLYVLGAGMFAFLLPQQITEFWIFPVSPSYGIMLAVMIKVVFFLLFALGLYSLYLTENIFTVSTIRTIQLARAANAVGFLMILTIGFLGFNAILSFRLPFYFIFITSFLISFPLFLVGLWSIKLEETISATLVVQSLTLAFIEAEYSTILSFWPISLTVGSLALTTAMYVLLGLYQQDLLKRMFRKTVYEYLSVGLIVFVIILLTI